LTLLHQSAQEDSSQKIRQEITQKEAEATMLKVQQLKDTIQAQTNVLKNLEAQNQSY